MKDKILTLQMICDGISRGLTLHLAIDYAGIARPTYYGWLKDKPELENMVKKAKADYALRLLPKVEEKNPWNLLKSVCRGEYIDDPTTAIQVNIERPLLDTPSETLLEMRKKLVGSQE